ncbi:MAG: hypothetical protein EA355_07725 [Rhodobacteraceae bacterium]|nr:MAG: hypothetical protein EA355_07725 [Paracoccaceae bacterium]
MSGFDPDWLALRAPADDAARDAGLLAQAAAWVRPGETILDLGAGTGATLGALGPLAPRARWRLADNDAALLALAAARGAAIGALVETVVVDLAAAPEAVFTPAPRLVTASAFFDLLSGAAIVRLAEAAARAGAAVYAALTYDGVERWEPPHPEDAAVRAAFLADMRRDKGFGAALGADAAPALASALAEQGYRVATAPSPWRLEAPRDAALIAALAVGQAEATGAGAGWLAARRAARRVVVGHVDVFATPG